MSARTLRVVTEVCVEKYSPEVGLPSDSILLDLDDDSDTATLQLVIAQCTKIQKER